MKKNIGFAIGALFLVPCLAFAADLRFGDQPSVGVQERASNVYLMGGTVTSAGSVTGDVVAGAGNVVISGPVSEDVMAGGGNVTILSNVGGDIRAGGGNVVIQSNVGGDVVAGGGSVTLGGTGVGKDAVLGGGNVRIEAPVAGYARVRAGNVYINSRIAGAVEIDANKITLGPSADIVGDLTYRAPQELIKEQGAVVRGQVHYTPTPAKGSTSPQALIAIFSLIFLGKFLAQLVCALIVGLLFRRYARTLVERATRRILPELGRGLIAFAAIPVISVLCLVTVVGIPFGIIGMLAFVAVLLLTWILAPLITGALLYHYILKKEIEVTWVSILAGAVIYSILGLIPFIGWLVILLITLVTLGAIISVKWEVVREWR